MPCSEKRARRLMEKGEAKPYWYQGIFCIIILFLILLVSDLAYGVVVGAIGDSISVGWNAEHLGFNYKRNFSTGKNIKSQAVYLNAFHTFNAAFPGDWINTIQQQVNFILPFNPNYVTILIGANDLCHSDILDWDLHLRGVADDVRQALSKLDAPNRKIVLIGVPDILRIYELGKNDEECKTKWYLTHKSCPALLDPNNTEKDFRYFKYKLDRLNGLYEQLAHEFPSVTYIDKTAKFNFQAEHISRVDCFHPSEIGQQAISDAVWFENEN